MLRAGASGAYSGGYVSDFEMGKLPTNIGQDYE